MIRTAKVFLIWMLSLGFFALLTSNTDAKESVLRIGVQYDLSNLDPARIPNMNDPQMQVAIFEGLLRYKLGSLELEPALATSWKRSDDGLTYKFSLRQGVQFHEGYGELKAKDVVYSFERTKDPQFKGTTTAGQLATIKSISADDDYTVTITFAAPDPAFLHKLAGFAGYIISEKAATERGQGFGQKPVGTGPYMFDHWVSGQEVVLVNNEKYWGAKPQLDRVVYVPVADATTMYNAFEAGDLDMIPVVQPEKLVKYRNDKNMQVYSVPGLQVRHIGMNENTKPFDDLRVRQAVSYAINREEINKGLWKDTTTTATGFFAPSVEHALVNAWNPVYDPAKAKQLLQDAGYADGFETVLSTTPLDRFLKPATIVQQNLQAVGINAKIETLEVSAFLGKLRKGEMAMFSMTKGFDPVPDRTINSQFRSTNFPGDNWTKFSDPEVDEWLKQASSTLDEKVRDDLFRKIQQRVLDRVDYYLLDWETFHIACGTKVKGFVLDPYRAIRLDNVSVNP